MKERTIWLKPGQEVEYCPYCHSGNVRPCEKGPLWTCQTCLHDFIVKHRAPEPKPKPRAMSPEEFHALEQKAKQQEEDSEKKICQVCGAELYDIEGGYACYTCGARFGVSRSGQIFSNHVVGFRPAS